MEPLSIALVSDFYLPDLGGVELQIQELGKYLKSKGHKVIVVTHCRPDHFGVMDVEGIPTYYLAWGYSASGAIYPTFFMEYPEAKEILIRQRIDIMHVHQSTSTLGVSYALYAYHMGLKIVHTEHSLFSLRTNTDLHLSWVIITIYKLYSKFICVSRAVRNNLILRSGISSNSMVVIPNAVLSAGLQRIERIGRKIRIVIVGRLVYRRGTDLLIKLLPALCERNKGRFVMEIVGDGPKMKILRLIIEKHNLGSMIVLHGSQPNERALQIVRQCDIFLSPALTESFGIALVQAAHLGLYCVSTNVGGVGEILPSDRLHTVDVTPNSIIIKLQELMHRIEQENGQKWSCPSQEVFYRPQDCFERVIEVYHQVKVTTKPSQKMAILKDIFIKGSLPAVLLVLMLAIYTLIDIFSKTNSFLRRKLKFQ